MKSSSRLQVLSSQAPAARTACTSTRRGALRDKRVRTAFLRAVDLDKLVSSVSFKQYRRAWSQLSPRTLGYDKDIEGAGPTTRSWPDGCWTRRAGRSGTATATGSRTASG
ncbi:hypothetical protein NKH77_47385 [Streptomyces sp. M19]